MALPTRGEHKQSVERLVGMKSHRVRVGLLIKQIARSGAPRAAEGARGISSGQHDRRVCWNYSD